MQFALIAFQGDHVTTPAFADQHGLSGRIILDSSGSMMSQVGRGRCGTAVVDRNGRVRYRGAPDGVEVSRVLRWLATEG